MNRLSRFIIAACILNFCLTGFVTGQTGRQDPSSITEAAAEPHSRIQLITRSYGDSIVLRWAPDKPVAWSVTNRFGYTVTRSYVTPDSVYITERLTPEPLLPWPLEKMMEVFGPADTIAAVAAEVIHGEGLAPVMVDDSGGGFIENLIRQRELQETRFAFAMQAADFSPAVAGAMALRYVDRDVTPGVLYEYAVVAETPASLLEIGNGSGFLVCRPHVAAPGPEEVDIRQTGHNRIEVAWSRDASTGYFVERSSDGGATFQRRNHKPYYSTEPDPRWDATSPTVAFYSSVLAYYHLFPDSADAGTTYHYRVQGIDAFGDLSLFSDLVSITPVAMIPLETPVLLGAATHNGTEVKVSWLMRNEEPDLAGFLVEKGPGHEGPWQVLTPELLPPGATEYIDTLASATRGGYYRVVARGHSGRESFSFAVRGLVEDYDPPATPTGLTGIVYYDGVVDLFWDDSPEPDLRGYRLAYSNHADHEFTMITPRTIGRAHFRDTIPVSTLTRKIYYKVLAEDLSGNRSPYTEVLELTRPDIIPPVRPVLLAARQDETTVFLTWTPSPSDDLLGYRIFRKPVSESRWDLLQLLEAPGVSGHITFEDSPTPSPTPYEYTIEAIDQAGNSSGMSRPVSFRVRGPSVVAVPITVTAHYDHERHAVKLTWTCDTDISDYQVVLLRGVNTGVLSILTTLGAAETGYTDRNIRRGMELHYVVQLRFGQGRRSENSETVTIQIP